MIPPTRNSFRHTDNTTRTSQQQQHQQHDDTISFIDLKQHEQNTAKSRRPLHDDLRDDDALPPPSRKRTPQDTSYRQHDDNDAFYRNTTALHKPQDLRKYNLKQQRLGLDFVARLQDAGSSKKKVDVTGKRRERKSVLPSETWGEIQDALQRQGILLESREKVSYDDNDSRTKATLTYYGTSAVFYNHQVATKIRMRIRYYVTYLKDENGMIRDVQRAGVTRTKGFLELKVKSPRAHEENSVDKYRLLVSDSIIAQLVNLDATQHDTFATDMERIRNQVRQELGAAQETLVHTVFDILETLAIRKPSFIRPSLVITYERNALKYVEHNYPIPSPPRQQSGKTESNRRQQRRRFLRRRPFSAKAAVDSKMMDETDSVSTKNTDDVEHHDIEYQFTIDQNVRAHYPLLPKAGADVMPIEQHFDESNLTTLMKYPANARVVEFKEPLVVATLPARDRSAHHTILISTLVDRMREDIMWGDYDENIGKYGNFRSRLFQEHSVNQIRNEQIRVDFTGTGSFSNSPGRRRSSLINRTSRRRLSRVECE